MTNAYDDLIMDHIKNARNYRVLEVCDRRASGSNPLCGDEMLVFIKLDGDHIADAAFQCVCCGISMASASVMTDMVKGKTTEAAMSVVREIVETLASPDEAKLDAQTAERLALIDTVRRFPARRRCALLPWVTLRGALTQDENVIVDA